MELHEPTMRCFAAVAVMAVLFTAACARVESTASAMTPGGKRGGAGGPPTVAVSTAAVVEKAMTSSPQAVGNVEARSTVEVHAQITGQLTAIGFTEGEDVAAGQLLFTIDPRPFRAALSQTEATLAKDAAQAKNADVTASRSASLFARGLIARADLDASESNKASLDAAVLADAAQVANARLQLQYTTITAPVSGRTGALLVHTGALVRANDTNPMLVINQIAPVYVSFSVPSQQLDGIRAEMQRGALPVGAHVAGSTAAPAHGTVTFIDNVVDPGTDTIRLKATFPNSDHRLWPGQFVEVALRLSVEPHAIVAPASAIQPSQQGTFAYVVKADGTVEARPVTVARTDGPDSVIQRGLRAGEVVVTDGQLQLNPGSRVSVKAPVAGGTSP
jgi:multidrug efflux system membrane fusion protein